MRVDKFSVVNLFNSISKQYHAVVENSIFTAYMGGCDFVHTITESQVFELMLTCHGDQYELYDAKQFKEVLKKYKLTGLDTRRVNELIDEMLSRE